MTKDTPLTELIQIVENLMGRSLSSAETQRLANFALKIQLEAADRAIRNPVIIRKQEKT